MTAAMDTNRFKFSILRFLWLDYPAYNTVLFPVVLWAVTAVLVILDYRAVWQGGKAGSISSTTLAVFYVAILLSLVCIPLVLIRLRLFWSIYKGGFEIQGKITQTLFQRDKGQIFITYRHKEYEYKARMVVHKTNLTQLFKKDQKVMLVALPKDPKQVFIRDLYLEAKK
jgi:hypothetical protein